MFKRNTTEPTPQDIRANLVHSLQAARDHHSDCIAQLNEVIDKATAMLAEHQIAETALNATLDTLLHPRKELAHVQFEIE